MIIHKFEQGTEEWNKIRAGRITGTRFKTLMSDFSTKGYKDLITDLACELITKEKDRTFSNKFMDESLDMEEEAIREYENITFSEVEQIGFITPDEDNEFYDWVGVSPDGLAKDVIIEIKCPLNRTHWNYIKKNKLPTEYRHQVQSQLFVSNEVKRVDFLSFCRGLKPFLIQVFPDKALHEEYKHRLRRLTCEVQSEIEMYKRYNYM